MTEIKRPNYFTSEFLVEKDFIDEQTYHRDMRHRHNQLLHTWGVVDGLTVSKTGDNQVTVSPGMAINKDGKEIILPSDPSPQPINISGTGDVYVTIEYQDVKDETDKDTTSGVINQYRRITERPLLKSTTSEPTNDGAVILLAKVNLISNGNINTLDNSVRTFVSAKIAPRAVTIDQLADNSVNAAKIIDGAVGTAELANGSVTVDKLADNSVNAAKIVDGAVGTAELANDSVSESKLTPSVRGKLDDLQQSQWRHNRNLHTFGVAGDGLVVLFADGWDYRSWDSAITSVDLTISPGMAIDLNGREILLSSAVTYTLSVPQGSSSISIYLILRTDSGSQQGIIAENSAPPEDGSVIILTRIDGRNGTLSLNKSFRQVASARINKVKQKVSIQVDGAQQQPCLETISQKILAQSNQSNAWSSGISNESSISASGKATSTGIHNTSSISTSGEATSTGIHNTCSASVAQEFARSYGINSYCSASAAQAAANSYGISSNSSASGKTNAWSEGISASSSASSSDLNANTFSFGLRVSSSVSSPQPNSNAYSYGVYASASGTNATRVCGVYTTATGPTGSYPLYVEGKARITGGLAPGHITDRFINRSGQRLRTGDVVKLKGTPIARFSGENNKIPIAEVTLADRENDSKVIGIVDSEAIPGPDTPDTRVGADDPTFVEDRGELDVVILGAYAHCKVDATETPIEVGDLLTSSNNPGHAKKATNPKLGSIIGKALEPFATGTGYIAVFVNIQ